METFLLIRSLAKSLITPPTPLWILLLLGWGLRKRKPLVGALLFWLALSAEYLMATSYLGNKMSHYLEVVPPITPAMLKEGGYEAIVVLGGGVDEFGREFGQPSLLENPLSRLRYAAYLSRETGIPILASGGNTDHHVAEADVMKIELERDFGLKMKWIENKSRTTWENATLSTEILQKEGIHKIAVVTQAWHMKRAVWAFQQQTGFQVIGAPTEFADTHWIDAGVAQFTPDVYAFFYTSLAVREICSDWAYRLSGKH